MLYIWSKAGITAATAAISEMKYRGGPGRLVGLGRVADEGRYHGCRNSDGRRSDRYVWPSDHGCGGDSTVRGTWHDARGGGEHELGTRKGWRVAFFDMAAMAGVMAGTKRLRRCSLAETDDGV